MGNGIRIGVGRRLKWRLIVDDEPGRPKKQALGRPDGELMCRASVVLALAVQPQANPTRHQDRRRPGQEPRHHREAAGVGLDLRAVDELGLEGLDDLLARG